MSPEVDLLIEAAENALTEAACADIPSIRRQIIEKALQESKRLESIAPDYFNTYHVQGVLWFHHPDNSPERFRNTDHYLRKALQFQPASEHSSYYLGILHFCEKDYSTALAYFLQITREYWTEQGILWRWLKAWECKLVCQARLDLQALRLAEVQEFIAECLLAHREDYAVPATPVELWTFITSDYARKHPDYAGLRNRIDNFVREVDCASLLSDNP